jgi:hypothetical protein
LREAVSRLYDPLEPIAATNRRLGSLAHELGLPRPSYAQVRRLVQVEQRRRQERLERLARLDELADGILRRRDPYDLFGNRRRA